MGWGGPARILGHAALRFVAVVVVAVTFAFVMEAIWPRLHPDPRPLLDQYVSYWATLLITAFALATTLIDLLPPRLDPRLRRA